MITITEEFTYQKLDILWEPAGDGARILRVYGEHPVVALPETIEGRPVTEIGAYCFSRSEPHLPEQYFHFYTGEQLGNPFGQNATQPNAEHPALYEADAPTGSAAYGHLSCLSGSLVEAIRLPASVTTLHNAAFYNCRKLHTLSVGPGIRSIGSDEFMNCTSLSQLILRGQDTESTGLSLLLERFEENLLVLFTPEEEDSILAALFFPEYYEWLDEISPAHLFSRSIHGEGFRMRKCFENGRVNYEKYDQCFENALKLESDESLCQIAFTRLRWPNGLKEEACALYEDALKARLHTAVSMAVRDKDLQLLLFLCRYFTGEDYSQAISACVAADWGEGSARLMEEKHQNGSFARKSFSFDDF
ncbi:hypothetical protein BN3660_00291 [Eubacteriaceae bacterium CHKCI004]|nr:hypothetical protein BN3660_00291 [Eubacteriaceae bacterium CHKCI004]